MTDLREQYEDYIAELFAGEDDALRAITTHAEAEGLPSISVRPIDGRLLYWLAKLANTRTIVEIGTLGGYSGTWLARALPADGHLYTLEVSAKHAEVAAANFARAGVADRVTIIQGAASEVFHKVEPYGPFDMAFIDADKGGYGRYLDWAAANLRPGGIVAAHNTYRDGRVMLPVSDDDKAIDAFNRALANDPRLEGIILPLGDGMAVGRRV
jgi:caffeoyl-CoA O-methyltransferase